MGNGQENTKKALWTCLLCQSNKNEMDRIMPAIPLGKQLCLEHGEVTYLVRITEREVRKSYTHTCTHTRMQHTSAYASMLRQRPGTLPMLSKHSITEPCPHSKSLTFSTFKMDLCRDQHPCQRGDWRPGPMENCWFSLVVDPQSLVSERKWSDHYHHPESHRATDAYSTNIKK